MQEPESFSVTRFLVALAGYLWWSFWRLVVLAPMFTFIALISLASGHCTSMSPKKGYMCTKRRGHRGKHVTRVPDRTGRIKTWETWS